MRVGMSGRTGGGESVIIIGAGLAGLAAGCYLQMNGYRTRIFEHHTKPGGVVTGWKREGFNIDGGIHFLMGHRPGLPVYDMYRELGLIRNGNVVDLTVYGCFVNQADGRSVRMTGDLARTGSELKRLFPRDGAVIDSLLRGARAFRDASVGMGDFSRPPELKGRLDTLKDLWSMRRVFSCFAGANNKPVEERYRDVSDPFFYRILKHMFLPEVPAWFLMMLLGLLAKGQMGLLAKGSLDFALSLAERYTELGGQVTYRSTVEKILVRDGRAAGVRLQDGNEYLADTVVSAADGHSVIFGMLDGRYLNDSIKGRYATWPLVRPIVMVNCGVRRVFPEEPPFLMIMPDPPLTVNAKPVEMIFTRIFNYGPSFAPPGMTLVQAEFDTQWEYWNDLQSLDRARYDAEKQRIAGEVLQRLDRLYPGLSGQVEMVDVATPYTTWRYTRNRRGAYIGWQFTPQAMMAVQERSLPGLSNFYMAGQWVVGGSVPGCLYSGRHVAEIICRRDRNRFTTIPPSCV